MVKGLKSLLAGTAILSLVGCATPEIIVHQHPASPRYPITVTRTEHVYFSIQNVPSQHSRHRENFQNPTYNGWREHHKPHYSRHKEYSGHNYRK
jgi:hypothetical protein